MYPNYNILFHKLKKKFLKYLLLNWEIRSNIERKQKLVALFPLNKKVNSKHFLNSSTSKRLFLNDNKISTLYLLFKIKNFKRYVKSICNIYEFILRNIYIKNKKRVNMLI